MGSSYGSTEDCKAVIKRASETTVDITLNGFGNLTGGGNMNLGDFTISGVNVEKADDGTIHSVWAHLNLPNQQWKTQLQVKVWKVQLQQTNGKANITVAFKPGAMPMAITAVFTGNVKKLVHNK